MQAGAMPTTNTKCTEYRAYKVYQVYCLVHYYIVESFRNRNGVKVKLKLKLTQTHYICSVENIF